MSKRDESWFDKIDTTLVEKALFAFDQGVNTALQINYFLIGPTYKEAKLGKIATKPISIAVDRGEIYPEKDSLASEKLKTLRVCVDDVSECPERISFQLDDIPFKLYLVNRKKFSCLEFLDTLGYSQFFFKVPNTSYLEQEPNIFNSKYAKDSNH